MAEPLSPPDSRKVLYRVSGSGKFGRPYRQKDKAKNCTRPLCEPLFRQDDRFVSRNGVVCRSVNLQVRHDQFGRCVGEPLGE